MRRFLFAAVLAAAALARAEEPLPPAPIDVRVRLTPAATLWVNHTKIDRGDRLTVTLPPNKPALLRAEEPGYAPAWKTFIPTEAMPMVELRLRHDPIPVLFRAEHAVTVLCDGAERGTTPCHVFFDKPGVYRVTLRADGRLERQVSLDLRDGKPRVIDSDLLSSTAELRLATTPAGAQIALDGIPKGTTPATLTGIRAGEHTVTLALEGYKPFTHTLTLESGQSVALEKPLERLPAGLTITTLPTGCRVYVDGIYRGDSDLTLTDLREGEHRLRIEHPGYAQEERVLTLTAGGRHVEEFRLRIIRGSLAVQTQPGAVQVWEGDTLLLTTEPGKDGYTSLIGTRSMVPGKHTLTFRAYGYADKTVDVEIAAEKTASLKVPLAFAPNLTLRTKTATYRGVLTKFSADGTITLELKPGLTRTFTPADAPVYDKDQLTKALEALSRSDD